MRRNSRPLWQRSVALLTLASFGWSVVLAQPVYAQTHQPPERHPGVRPLSPDEMRHQVGATGGHGLSYSAASGPTYPWEGSTGGVNSGNGNKLTSIPLVGWTQRGGLPVSLVLYHNSQGNHNSELGNKWTFSFDLYLMSSLGITPDMTIHWGNDLAYTFTNNGSNVFSAPVGIYDSLVKNVDGTYTLTTKSQVKYHFTTVGVALYCDTITDENGNALSISHNTGGYVTSVTDATSRSLSFSYDVNNRITGISDPLSRSWGFTYSGSGSAVNLASVSLPTLGGSSYTYSFTYNTAHDITQITSPGSRTVSFTYNSDDSLASATDGCSNTTGYSYATGATTITDANSHTLVDNYTSGRLTSEVDNLSHSVAYTYDSSNNKTQITDQRSKNWNQTFDSRGNVLTAHDPYSDTVTMTYNSHNKVLTVVAPTGEETDYTYDGYDNLTGIAHKDHLGTTQASESYTVNGYGLRTDAYDANSHHTQYGFDTDGNLSSVTTPLGNVTQFTSDGIGVTISRTDAAANETDYTLDAWERVTTKTLPDTSTQTFTYDTDNNLTQFVDSTGTTTRTYDNDNRLLTESKGGSTVVTHTYDATGKKGLLSTTVDANSRTLTYSWDSLNRLSSVAETAGTTGYSYDNAGNETGITNANGTTVTKVYDDAGQLTSITNKNSGGTTLSSFSYVYDANGRRTSGTELSGDVVSWGYDWGGRLISESRTGTNAYSASYTLDGAGNRTSQTVGSATTSFTLDNDDELTATSSSTGGFVNSYSYNANGEQTGRTLSGTAYTQTFDYEGQLTGITHAGVTTSFAYDAVGRRVSRTAGGTTTNFLYDGGAILLEKQGGTTTATYTYGNALIRKDGEIPLYDGLGSARAETNSGQSVTATLTTEAFGQTVASTGSTGSAYGFGATSGYRNDGDAGLTHVGARYYDSQVGRFITRDTFLEQKPYLYCEHDPVNAVDPSGHFGSWKEMWAGFLLAGAYATVEIPPVAIALALIAALLLWSDVNDHITHIGRAGGKVIRRYTKPIQDAFDDPGEGGGGMSGGGPQNGAGGGNSGGSPGGGSSGNGHNWQDANIIGSMPPGGYYSWDPNDPGPPHP